MSTWWSFPARLSSCRESLSSTRNDARERHLSWMVDCHRERFPQHFQEHALGDPARASTGISGSSKRRTVLSRLKSTNESRKCRTLCPKSRQCLVKTTCGGLFSTCSTTLNWMISCASCVTNCPGFAPLQRNVHFASLDECASTSSGLCRNTVSLKMPKLPFGRAPVPTSGTSDRALSLSTIKHVVVFTQDLCSFSESHADGRRPTVCCFVNHFMEWRHSSQIPELGA